MSLNLVSVGEVGADLPAGGRGTYSNLHDIVAQVMGDPQYQNRPLCIADYPDTDEGRQRAVSAVQSLRQKYGYSSDATGNKFSSAKVRPSGSEEDRRGVWVIYDPSKVVEGAKAAHDAKVAEAGQKQQAQKKAADAKKKAAADKAKREAEKAAATAR